MSRPCGTHALPPVPWHVHCVASFTRTEVGMDHRMAHCTGATGSMLQRTVIRHRSFSPIPHHLHQTSPFPLRNMRPQMAWEEWRTNPQIGAHGPWTAEVENTGVLNAHQRPLVQGS